MSNQPCSDVTELDTLSIEYLRGAYLDLLRRIQEQNEDAQAKQGDEAKRMDVLPPMTLTLDDLDKFIPEWALPRSADIPVETDLVALKAVALTAIREQKEFNLARKTCERIIRLDPYAQFYRLCLIKMLVFGQVDDCEDQDQKYPSSLSIRKGVELVVEGFGYESQRQKKAGSKLQEFIQAHSSESWNCLNEGRNHQAIDLLVHALILEVGESLS